MATENTLQYDFQSNIMIPGILKIERQILYICLPERIGEACRPGSSAERETDPDGWSKDKRKREK